MSQTLKIKGAKIQRLVTVRGQVGKALVLAPLPLAIADIEVNMNWV